MEVMMEGQEDGKTILKTCKILSDLTVRPKAEGWSFSPPIFRLVYRTEPELGRCEDAGMGGRSPQLHICTGANRLIWW